MQRTPVNIGLGPALRHRRAASCFEGTQNNSLSKWHDRFPSSLSTWAMPVRDKLQHDDEMETRTQSLQSHNSISRPESAELLATTYSMGSTRDFTTNITHDNTFDPHEEGHMSECQIMHDQHTPDKRLPDADRKQDGWTTGGSAGSDISASTFASTTSSGLPQHKHEIHSPFNTTIITPPDDADDRYSTLSDRTITCNLRRSPQRRVSAQISPLQARSRSMRAEHVSDPWKCDSISISRYDLPIASFDTEDGETLHDDSHLSRDGSGRCPLALEASKDWIQNNQAWHANEIDGEMGGIGLDDWCSQTDPKDSSSQEHHGDHDTRSHFHCEEQYDQVDGEPMSPRYPVPSSPTVLLTSRPVTPEMMYHYFPRGEFDRMDPAAAQACRDASLGPIPTFGAEDDTQGNGEDATEEEIDRVLASYQGFIFDDITAANYKDAIYTMEEHLQVVSREENELEQLNLRERDRLRTLVGELDRMMSTLAEGNMEAEGGKSPTSLPSPSHTPMGSQRQARVLRYMATRLRENMWQHHCRASALSAARREASLIRTQIERVEERLRDTCARMNNHTPGPQAQLRSATPWNHTTWLD